MNKDDRRLHFAAAIAGVFTVMWMVGLSQHGTAFTGPEGMPSPLLYQIAEGANLPAALIQRAIRAVPLLNDELAGSVVFFGAVTLLWLWMFAWIPYLRGRKRLPLSAVKLSITWCALVAAACFYRLSDIDALRTFPSLILTAGLENALVASSALLWQFTLLWGLFLACSAVLAAMRVMKAHVVSEIGEQEKRERRARKEVRLERKRKRVERHKAASRQE